MLNHKSVSLGLLLAALKTTVLATTAPGFPFQVQNTLNVTFGTNFVSPAGELVPRPDTATPPNITTTIWTSTGKAVLFMVDSDVPRNGTRVELLHWLVSGVTLMGNSTLVIPSPGEASYRQPSPPVGDTPHAYTFVLFEQPANFSVPSEFADVLQSRVFFNMSGFAAAAGLGQPFTGNYITVQNLTGTPTTTFPPPRSTSTASTSASASNTAVPFPGAAAQRALGGGKALWASIIGTGMVAGVAAFAL